MRGLRVCGILTAVNSVLVGSVLVAGCTAGNDHDDGPGTRSSTGERSPAGTRSPAGGSAKEGGRGDGSPGTGTDAPATASGSLDALTDPAKYPTTAAQGQAVIGRLIPDAALFGADVRPAVPYEAAPGRWSDLAENCVWRVEETPEDVLATRTRYFWLPAEKSGGKGAVRLSTTITVHRTALDAAWEQAGMLEEALGCREQVLRPGERLTNLHSYAFGQGEGSNVDLDDSLLEIGECRSETRGGPYPYFWQQAALGSVVMSASACGGEGRTADEIQSLVQDPLIRVMLRAEKEIGSDGSDTGQDTEPGTKGGS